MIAVKKQLFDLSYLKLIDDKSLIAEVINLYIEEAHLDLSKMKVALHNSDYEAIYATVDKMKVSTGMIQADALYLVLEKIAIISKYGGEYAKLCELGNFAYYEFDQLRSELELYLKDIYKQPESEQDGYFQSLGKVYNQW